MVELVEPFDVEALYNLRHDFEVALDATRQRAHKWVAWEILKTVDAAGSVLVQPASLEAIASLENAYAIDNQDGELLHHLAIAYHALAWDKESGESHTAGIYWEKALYWWERLRKHRPFWEALKAKGASLSETFDPEVLEIFRKNLVEHVLQIHVDFIAHYSSLRQYDSVQRHIQLINRAPIPPTSRDRFVDLIYHAMTSPLPVFEQQNDFEGALSLLEQFISLFPRYIPALQRYLTITRRYLVESSPEPLRTFDLRVSPHWRMLITLLDKSPELRQEDFAASTIVVDVASQFGENYFRQGIRLTDLNTDEQIPPGEPVQNETWKAYEYCIEWFLHLEVSQPRVVDRQNMILQALFWCVNHLIHAFNQKHPDVHADPQSVDETLEKCTLFRRTLVDQNRLDQVEVQLRYMRALLCWQAYNVSYSAALKQQILTDCEEALRIEPDHSAIKDLRDMVNWA